MYARVPLLVAALAIPQAAKWKRHSSTARSQQRGVRAAADSKCGKGKVVPHAHADRTQDMAACTRHVITCLTLSTEERIKYNILSVTK